jgi:hypothetical protein
MKPPHWRCRSCGIIITDCGSAPSTCRFCQGTSGFDYIGYEGDYDLHKEMYRVLHPAEEPKGPIFSGPENTQQPFTNDLLRDNGIKDKKKKP